MTARLPDVYTRLHENKHEKEKSREDVLITTLSSDTVRWIKQRRTQQADHRVAITHYRESQLREIFDGLDFDSTSIIDLEELKKAVKYAEEELRGKRGPTFKNVEKMFEAMDEDGNGEVDYHEFMISMTGSSKSLFDTASEADVDKLRMKFVEFAFKKKREHFVKVIEDKSAAATHLDDHEKCKYFQELFAVGQRAETAEHNEKALEQDADHSSTARKHVKKFEEPIPEKEDKFDRMERILDEFVGLNDIGSNRSCSSEQLLPQPLSLDTSTARERFYLELEARAKEQRRNEYESIRRDADSRDVARRVDDERKYIQRCRKQSLRPVRRSGGASSGLPSVRPDRHLSVKQELGVKRAAMRDARELWKRPSSAANDYVLDLSPRYPEDFHFASAREQMKGVEGFDDASSHESLDGQFTALVRQERHRFYVELDSLPTRPVRSEKNTTDAAFVFDFDSPRDSIQLKRSNRHSLSCPSITLKTITKKEGPIQEDGSPDMKLSGPAITPAGLAYTHPEPLTLSLPQQVANVTPRLGSSDRSIESTATPHVTLTGRQPVLNKKARRSSIAAQIAKLSTDLS